MSPFLGALRAWPDSTRQKVQQTVNGLLATFLIARQAEGRAPLTIESYRRRLRTLVELAGDTPLRSIDPDLIRRWLVTVRQGQRGRETRGTTIEGHRIAAAMLFTWAVREGYLRRSPLDAIARVRARRREIVILSPDEVGRLMAIHNARSPLGIRNRAMIAFLYDTGVRVSELVGLRLADVHPAEGIAVVRGKTGERTVPLSISLRRLLLLYTQLARPRVLGFAESGALFVGKAGSPFHPNAVNQVLRRAALRAVIAKRVYPHILRHSFGTQYIRNGGDPYTLQKILGHMTMAMVTVYMHMAAEDVAQRHASASPLDRMLAAAAGQ